MCCRNEKKQEGCRRPKDLKGKPEDCTPEQVKKCHGDVREHPCVAENKSGRPKGGNA